MPSGSLSLAEISERLTVLEVRCTKCDRRGRYKMATLIERYGADFAGPDLRDKLSAYCPGMPPPNMSGATSTSQIC